MRNCLLALLLWVAASSGAAAQSPGSLAARIRQADQVLIVSHEDFRGHVDSAGHGVPAPAYVLNGRPNLAIASKSKTLTPAERTRLGIILTRPFRPGAVTVMRCCEPRHAIFLVSKNQTAYVDLCLSCRCLGTSQNLRLPDFDNRRWEELEKFVSQLGLRYEGF